MFPLLKEFQVTLGAEGWPNGPPPELVSLQGTQTLDIRTSLLHTAMRTRPPSLYGFHLSDVWAWQRYLWAFATGPELRLRPEWAEIDPHQKMVMSDDLGMGLTTHLLSDALDLRDIVDTIRYIRIVDPDALEIVDQGIRGPSKTPDFVATDGNGNLHVIECKGTQTSHRSLMNAIARGMPQKANVRSGNGTIQHAVVAGLFIPQSASKQGPRIHVTDPDMPTLESIMSRHSREVLLLAAKQLELSKTLAFLNLPIACNALGKTRVEGGLPHQAREEIREFFNGGEEAQKPLMEYRTVVTEQEVAGTVEDTVKRLRFETRIHPDILVGLENGRPVKELLLSLMDERIGHSYRSETTDEHADLYTPLGLRLRLTLMMD
jgi:hypothetical protein